MPVREFELYHGCVLTKLLRSEKPVALRLVETRPKENWSTYTLNDAVDVFITHSKNARTYSRQGGGVAWTFVFSMNQLRQMGAGGNGRPVWVALVCGRRSTADGMMFVCMLAPEEVVGLVDFSLVQASLTVRKPDSGRDFHLLKDRAVKLSVRESRLDNWTVPGG